MKLDSVHIACYFALLPSNGKYEVKERFLKFVDRNQKTGELTANLISNTLEKYKIFLVDCRCQGYDNCSNMCVTCKTTLISILKKNLLYSPCSCLPLNLCHFLAAEFCTEEITFLAFTTFSFQVPKVTHWSAYNLPR